MALVLAKLASTKIASGITLGLFQYLTLLGPVLIKINIVPANFNTRPSLILSN